MSAVRIPELAIWSTELRARVASGLPIRYLVPDAVLDFIKEHRLYLAPNDKPPPSSGGLVRRSAVTTPVKGSATQSQCSFVGKIPMLRVFLETSKPT